MRFVSKTVAQRAGLKHLASTTWRVIIAGAYILQISGVGVLPPPFPARSGRYGVDVLGIGTTQYEYCRRHPALPIERGWCPAGFGFYSAMKFGTSRVRGWNTGSGDALSSAPAITSCRRLLHEHGVDESTSVIMYCLSRLPSIMAPSFTLLQVV